MTKPIESLQGALSGRGTLGALLVGACLLAAAPASAQSVQELGSFQDWSAYTYDSGGQKICFMSSNPTDAKGNYTRRGDIFTMVTHRPARGTRDVVSVEAGYTYKDGSSVNVDVDGNGFSLFTQGGNAWAPDADTDGALVKAMKAGVKMVIKGTSSRGTVTTDTYSLRGFTAAYDAISGACPK